MTPQPIREQDFLNAVLENAGALVVVLDHEGRICRFNRASEMLSGYAFAEVEGKFPWDTILPPEDADSIRRDAFEAFARSQQVSADRYTNYWLSRSGERHLIEWSNTLLHDSAGNMEFMVCVGTDITVRQHVDEALRMSEQRLREAEQLAHTGAWELDLLSDEVWWSDEQYRINGVPKGSKPLHQDAFLNLVHPDDKEILRKGFAEAMSSGTFAGDYRIVRPSGEVRHLYGVARATYDESGRPIRLAGTNHDITERRKSEEEIQRLAAIVRNSPDFIGISDLEGHALYLNDAGRKLVGIRDDAHFYSTSVPDYFPDRDREQVVNEIIPALMSKGRWVGDIHFRHFQSGGEIPVLFDIFRIDDPVMGKPINFATVTQDITARKHYETQINASNQLLSAVLDTTPVLIAYLDTDMNFVRVNAAYAAADGKDPDHFVGKNHFELFPDTENEAVFRRVLETGVAHEVKARPFQFEHDPERGASHWDWTLTPIKDRDDGAVTGLVLSLMNVTDRIEALEAAQRSERELKALNETLEARVLERTAEVRLQAQRNATILNTTTDGFFVSDTAGQLRGANPAFCAMLGYGEAELLGMTIADIEANERPQDVAAHIEKVIRNGHDRFDTRHRCKDGGLVEVEISVSLVDMGGEKLFYAFARDITARKASEAALTGARDEAQRANRAKSEFLARMSHELRTPMNAILGFAQLLEFEPIGAEPLGFAHEIRRAGDHLLELINELLDLSRIESGKLALVVQPLNYHAIIGDAVQIVQPLLSENTLSLHNRCGPQAMVLADPTRLKQILVNLLSNAAKYNRVEGSIQIDCHRSGEDRLQISVTDSGQGIAPEKLALLFKPFERLGAEFGEIDGTGIGLALSKQLAELMDGALGVESTPGRGSTFWLELPLAQAEQEHTVSDTGQQTPNAGHHTLLYIEDNAANLRVVEAIFRRNSQLRLLSATNGEYGLELARHYLPEVILLDIHLPGMDGYAVLAALQADAATRHIPLIALSADAMPMDIERGLAAGFAHYVTKPIDVDRFLNAVDCCLQGGNAVE